MGNSARGKRDEKWGKWVEIRKKYRPNPLGMWEHRGGGGDAAAGWGVKKKRTGTKVGGSKGKRKKKYGEPKKGTRWPDTQGSL